MSILDQITRSMHGGLHVSIGETFWYVLFAGVAWIVFYVLFRRFLPHRKIAPKYPDWQQLSWEVLYSLRSLLIFGVVGGIIVFASLSGWARLYWHFEDYGWAWFVCSIFIAIFLHDAYFYWTHRLMHHPRLFRAIHRVHHLSTNPTPWAAYSFSISEAFVQAGIGLLISFVLPVHPIAFFAFMIWQISFNVLGHCGYEIFPHWFLQTWMGKFLNTPTHHALHHEKFNANYGLYFNIWDRMMGTNHSQYEKRFAQVTEVHPTPVNQPLPACEAPSLLDTSRCTLDAGR